MQSTIHAAVAAVALFSATSAFGQVRVLYTGAAGLPTSNVPGTTGGEVFNDSASGQTTFDRPYVSPDGSLVGFVGDLEASGTFFDDVLVVAPIANPSAGMTLLEGAAIPGDASGRLTYELDQRVSLLNDGTAAFTTSTRIAGGTTNAGDSLITFNPATGAISEVLTEGSSFAGGTVGVQSINSPYLSPTGGVGAQTTLTDDTDVVAFESTVFETDGVTPPGAPAETAIFEFETSYFGNNGTSYLAQARSFPTNRTVDTTIVNGTAVIVGGAVLPNSGFNSVVTDGGPGFAGMNEAGLWYARGVNVDGTEWAVVDGGVVATEGDSLFAGSSETWADFDGIAVDSNGNYVLVGLSSTGEDVAVYNGETLLIRAGDSVGLNDLVLRDFSVDDIALSDMGDFVFAGRLNNGAGAASGQALVTVSVPEPATASIVALAAGVLLRRRR